MFPTLRCDTTFQLIFVRLRTKLRENECNQVLLDCTHFERSHSKVVGKVTSSSCVLQETHFDRGVCEVSTHKLEMEGKACNQSPLFFFFFAFVELCLTTTGRGTAACPAKV